MSHVCHFIGRLIQYIYKVLSEVLQVCLSTCMWFVAPCQGYVLLVRVMFVCLHVLNTFQWFCPGSIFLDLCCGYLCLYIVFNVSVILQQLQLYVHDMKCPLTEMNKKNFGLSCSMLSLPLPPAPIASLPAFIFQALAILKEGSDPTSMLFVCIEVINVNCCAQPHNSCTVVKT